jgi:hypothetical protein
MTSPRINTGSSPQANTSYEATLEQQGQSQQTQLQVPGHESSGASPPTRYEFIMSTGDESAAATKQNLKTVRSHVMKNYLQQQQQQRYGYEIAESSAAAIHRERRRGKENFRSSRSASREIEHSPIDSEGGRVGRVEVGSSTAVNPSVGYGWEGSVALGKPVVPSPILSIPLVFALINSHADLRRTRVQPADRLWHWILGSMVLKTRFLRWRNRTSLL